MHERDFEVGLAVTDNIAACLDRSRRFLMVLSPDLPASRWCMFEVDMARERMEGGRGDFLVVVKERPPKRRMNRTLAHILDNWTYLKWPGSGEEKGEEKKGEEEARQVFYMKLKHSILRGGGGGEPSPRVEAGRTRLEIPL